MDRLQLLLFRKCPTVFLKAIILGRNWMIGSVGPTGPIAYSNTIIESVSVPTPYKTVHRSGN
jgi:hypothetical protein